MPRTDAIAAFLDPLEWRDATRVPLAGDASNRRYDRLTLGDRHAVLMDADPDKGEDVAPFVRIADHLRARGFSAPQILAQDRRHGLLLLEDLGDALFARVAAADPGKTETLYSAAVDLLAALHRAPLPDAVPAYDFALMGQLSALSMVWYLGFATETETVVGAVGTTEGAHRLEQEVRALCTAHCTGPEVLVLRDFHAENLIWLPERGGTAQVGLLDFQDAMRGHPAYDLVSLLGDARRDVDPALADRMMDRYLSATGLEPAQFRRAAATLGAQRNLRILGVFARLCVRDGKAHYVDLIPRVWSVLQRDLQHPDLALLKNSVEAHLPPPTPDILNRLKQQCATAPTPS